MRVVVGIVQVVAPEASLIKNLFIHSEPLIIDKFPEILAFPITSNLAHGVLVPIPTLPVASTLIRWFPSPSARIMLFERFDARPVTLAPRIVLADPVIIPRAVE
jgi:hypothetical protein